MRLLDGDEARELAPILPDTVIGASFCPLDAQIESSRYVRAFAAAAHAHGATVDRGRNGPVVRARRRPGHPA